MPPSTGTKWWVWVIAIVVLIGAFFWWNGRGDDSDSRPGARQYCGGLSATRHCDRHERRAAGADRERHSHRLGDGRDSGISRLPAVRFVDPEWLRPADRHLELGQTRIRVRAGSPPGPTTTAPRPGLRAPRKSNRPGFRWRKFTISTPTPTSRSGSSIGSTACTFGRYRRPHAHRMAGLREWYRSTRSRDARQTAKRGTPNLVGADLLVKASRPAAAPTFRRSPGGIGSPPTASPNLGSMWGSAAPTSGARSVREVGSSPRFRSIRTWRFATRTLRLSRSLRAEACRPMRSCA